LKKGRNRRSLSSRPAVHTVGRRSVLISAVVTMLVGLAVFLVSSNVATLIIGRISQGVTIGAE
jgi:MFS family permease